MPSEIFPSSLRAKGVALATCSNWFNNFIIGLITPPLVINTGFGAYTFFAIFCLLSLIWTFYFIPETKGRTLEAMDQYVFSELILPRLYHTLGREIGLEVVQLPQMSNTDCEISK